MTEPDPDHDAPPSPIPLDYQGAGTRGRKGDLVLGAISFFLYLGVLLGGLVLLVRGNSMNGDMPIGYFGLITLLFIVLIGWMMHRGRKLFFPGVLIGLSLAILLLLGICGTELVHFRV